MHDGLLLLLSLHVHLSTRMCHSPASEPSALHMTHVRFVEDGSSLTVMPRRGRFEDEDALVPETANVQ